MIVGGAVAGHCPLLGMHIRARRKIMYDCGRGSGWSLPTVWDAHTREEDDRV